jgi:hypothetical protein
MIGRTLLNLITIGARIVWLAALSKWRSLTLISAVTLAVAWLAWRVSPWS